MITLDPKQWDFRGIPPEELATAIQYEYARESKLIREKKKAFDLDPNCLDSFMLEWFFKRYPSFPVPWLLLHEDERQAEGEAKPQFEFKTLQEETIDWKNQKYRRNDGYVIRVNFEDGINEIVAQFRKAISQEAKRIAQNKKRGMGSIQPWHKLKQLAALRLDTAKCLEEFIAEAMSLKDTKYKTDPFGVLPKYTASHGAIDAAKRLVLEIETELSN